MRMFSFKDLFYICKVNVRDLETKEIVVQTSIKSDIWVPYSEPSDEEFLVKSDFEFDLDPCIKRVFIQTFDEYIYPRIVAEYAELFKKNFKILDKYFKNDFVCTGSARTEPIGIPMIKRPTEEELTIYPNLCLTFERAYIFWNWNDELAMRNSSMNNSKCPLLEYKFYIYNNKTELETVECDTAFFHDDDSIIKNVIFGI